MVCIEDEIFRKYTPDFDKLKKYGFMESKSDFSFEKFFRNDEFKAVINVAKTGSVNGKVYDVENGDEFLPLRLEVNEGAFAAEVRGAYSDILYNIREKCFNENCFTSPQANRISALIYKKYGDKPLFMWEDYPDYGVFKNSETNKWYGIIMCVDRSKIGGKQGSFVDVMNVKLDPGEIVELLEKKGFYQAYHMNKKYWISIALDETLSDSVITSLIEESHSYAVSKTKKK